MDAEEAIDGHPSMSRSKSAGGSTARPRPEAGRLPVKEAFVWRGRVLPAAVTLAVDLDEAVEGWPPPSRAERPGPRP